MGIRESPRLFIAVDDGMGWMLAHLNHVEVRILCDRELNADRVMTTAIVHFLTIFKVCLRLRVVICCLLVPHLCFADSINLITGSCGFRHASCQLIHCSEGLPPPSQETSAETSFPTTGIPERPTRDLLG